MRWAAPVSLLAVLNGGGCLLFCEDGQPCDADGKCLPGYVCVETICQEAGVKERGEECGATAECKDGVCSDVNCGWPCANDNDCFGDATCQAGACACQPRCRAACTYPRHETCDTGKLCQQDAAQDRGFCQEGQCGPADGSACDAPRECVAFHGDGSGLCVALCEILAQQECLGTPPTGTRCCAADENCEHQEWLWNLSANPGNALGICLQSGDRDEGAVCSNASAQQWYCRRGLVCDLERGVCRRYCDPNNGQPACASGQTCNAISGSSTLPYGWCR